MPSSPLDRLLRTYRTPRFTIGQKVVCARRGEVEIVGVSDAPIPWPMGGGQGRRSHVVYGALERAVRNEANRDVAEAFGVTGQTVTLLRRALGVDPATPGTSKLRRAIGKQNFATKFPQMLAGKAAKPEWKEKVAAARRGKPRPPGVIAKLVASNVGRKLSAERRRKMSESHRVRGTRPPAAGKAWTKEELALLGTMPDSEIAKRIGRPESAVKACRYKLRIRWERRKL